MRSKRRRSEVRRGSKRVREGKVGGSEGRRAGVREEGVREGEYEE